MNKLIYSVLILFSIHFISCSSSQQSSDNDEQIYVFDEVPVEKTIDPPKTGEYPDIRATYYVVQIGAFTTQENAQDFAEISRAKTNYKSSIVYSESLNLHLVQIIPFFKSRTEAEEVRNNLWKLTEFVDAWIVTVNK